MTTHQLVLERKAKGLTQAVTAQRLGVNIRTVKLYWNKPLPTEKTA